MWVRGLKPICAQILQNQYHVAPRVGAWIETFYSHHYCKLCQVAPRVGAWIETTNLTSHSNPKNVAPRVGAWIETADASHAAAGYSRRTPCGCVD